MKKLLKILIGVVALAAVAVGVVLMMTAGLPDAADRFFAEVKAGNHAGAYRQLSADFRASTSERQFVAFLEGSALAKFADVSWNSRSISGGQGELVGTVVSDSGGVVPITLGFVKENDQWKIYSIHKPRAGVTEPGNAASLPSDQELVALTEEALLRFADAVNARDFSGFHGHISNLWRTQHTVEQLNDAFRQFMDIGVDMVPALRANSPQFDVTPAIDDDGVLILEGHYPTQPSRLFFRLRYIYEGVGWKLVGTSVDIK